MTGSVVARRRRDAGIQRNPGRSTPTPANTSGGSAPPGQPPPTWSPSQVGTFSVLVESRSSTPTDCAGTAHSGGGTYPLSHCGRLEHFCTAPAHFPLDLRFYVDSVARPRPAPFRAPRLTVTLDFAPVNGGRRRVTRASDTSPRHLGPGFPLATSFGQQFTVTTSESGSLGVQAQLHDPDSGASVAYTDAVPCELVPCV